MKSIVDWYSKKFRKRNSDNFFPPGMKEGFYLPDGTPQALADPIVDVYFMIERATSKQLFCWIEPSWFTLFEVGGCVKKVKDEWYQQRLAWGHPQYSFDDITLYDVHHEEFPTIETFYQAYPEWKERAKNLTVRFWEVWNEYRQKESSVSSRPS